MPKLICPNCAKFVTVSDEAAGTTVPCPECKAPFPVPARYDPVVSVPNSPPPPPPPHVPPPAAPAAPLPGLTPEALAAVTHPAPPLGAGYEHTLGLSLRQSTLAWVPAVGLTIVLLLTLFPWVGSYVGGSAVYSQTAWRALTGSPARNFHLEELSRQQAGWPADVLNRVSSDWPLMLTYLLLLIVAVALAWAERFVADINRTRLPRQAGFLADVWPYRVPVLAGLAAVLVVLLFLQAGRGFGLERAMRQAVAERFAGERERAAGNEAKLDEIEFRADQELSKFNLERTAWFELAVGLHLLVVLAMVGRFWLERRGSKPPPRLVLQY
ncbi:MAG TPA: hypothetical protein VD866_01800 [Urbifossiella sp.]|nr:hypothetical protein [Urbifossiella sp.]